jgi:hypothetical protein
VAHWSAYQTAIQLVAGLNVALYALPGLRNAELVDEQALFGEQSTVAKLIAEANRAEMFEEAISFRNRLIKHWEPVFMQFAAARSACLFMAAFTSAVLILGTGDWAEMDANPRLAWITIGAGFLPAAWLIVLNLRARSHRSVAVAIRQRMEAQVAEAGQRQSGGLVP